MISFSKYQQEIIRDIIKKTKNNNYVPFCDVDSILFDEFKKNGIHAISWENPPDVDFHFRKMGLPDKYDATLKINEIILLFDYFKRENLVLFLKKDTIYYKTDLYPEDEYKKVYKGTGLTEYHSKIDNSKGELGALFQKSELFGVGGKKHTIRSEDYGKKIKEIANATIFPSYTLKKLCDNNFKTTEQKTLFWTQLVAVIALVTLLLSAFI